MSVPAAYIGIILIWSTTPLAIQWSGDGVGFLFGVTARMLLGTVAALVMAALLGQGLRWNRRAVHAYLAAGVGIFGSMTVVYWSAQRIPSGWISVIFGLTPILTGLMARLWLKGEPFTPARIGGIACGLAGLSIIFGNGLRLDTATGLGIGGVLLGVVIHSASSVWVKRIDAGVPAIVQTAGGLSVSAPLFLLAWWLGDGHLPVEIRPHTAGSIVYLALLGSVLGFSMYYYVLRCVDAVRVALITLITPVAALLLGHLINQEPLTAEVVTGTTLILCGLGLFQFGERISSRVLAWQRR